LRAAGEGWYQAIDLAQKHLQREPWSEIQIELDELLELERRALIPPLDFNLPE
jgi:hypothetical protein